MTNPRTGYAGGVGAGQSSCHGVTDEDRTLGANARAERMDVGDEVVPRGRRPGRLAVPGEVGERCS